MKIKQTEDQRVFFTSDPHYGHKNIVAGVTSWVKPEQWPIPYNEWKHNVKAQYTYDIKIGDTLIETIETHTRQSFCKKMGLRDYGSLEEMNDTLVTRFNETVRATDKLYLLGDVAFGGKDNVGVFMNRLNCKNVYLVYGNHDAHIIRDVNLRGYFNRADYYMDAHIDGQMVCMFHYSARVWENSHKGSWFLYGHSHGSIPEIPNAKTMDVGVDTNDMYPYSFDELKKIMDKRHTMAVDHHGQ